MICLRRQYILKFYSRSICHIEANHLHIPIKFNTASLNGIFAVICICFCINGLISLSASNTGWVPITVWRVYTLQTINGFFNMYVSTSASANHSLTGSISTSVTTTKFHWTSIFTNSLEMLLFLRNINGVKYEEIILGLSVRGIF